MNNPKTILHFIEYLISDYLNFRAEIKAPLVAKSTIDTKYMRVKETDSVKLDKKKSLSFLLLCILCPHRSGRQRHGSEASMLTCGNKTLPLRKSRAQRWPLSTTGGARKQ